MAREQNGSDLRLISRYTRRLATTRRRWGKRVRRRVVRLLLKLFRRITGADLVYFRALSGSALHLLDGAIPQHSVPPNTRVPQEVKIDDGLSASLLRFFDAQGQVDRPFEATDCFCDEAAPCVEQLLAESPSGRWKPDEISFMRHVGSVVRIPLIVQNRLRGVFVGVAWQKQAFARTLAPAVERFGHTATLWFELAELHDGHALSVKAFKNLIAVFPLLSTAPTDDGFYAGLAAFLTAHCGLRWNRVLIFDCVGQAPDTAELVYAIGGLGERDHHRVQQCVKTEFRDIKTLIAERVCNPAPIRQKNGQIERTDSLYEAYVESPRKEKRPVRIPFGTHAPASKKAPCGNFLRQVVRDEGWQSGTALVVPICVDQEPFFQVLNHEYPKLFCASRTYLFPLWRMVDGQVEPVALVFVDNCYTPDRPTEPMLLLTRAVLNYVGHLLAVRHEQRFLDGWLGVLPAFRHGPRLKERWDTLFGYLARLLDKIQGKPADAFDNTNLSQDQLVRLVEDEIRKFEKPVAEICEVQSLLEERINPIFPGDGIRSIPNLADYLEQLSDSWEGAVTGLSIDRRWRQSDCARALSCDPHILDSAMKSVLENAVEASRQRDASRVFVRLNVVRVPSPVPEFDEFLELHVIDSGFGVDPRVVPYLFIDGFTSRKPNLSKEKHHGRGLSAARASIYTYHGDIFCADPGPSVDPFERTRTLGATFVLRFGVAKSRLTPEKGALSHAASAGR